MVENGSFGNSSFCTETSAKTEVLITHSVLAALALFGNSLVILSIIPFRKKRTVDNILICNLSLSNSLVCFFIVFKTIKLFYQPQRKDIFIVNIQGIVLLLLFISSVYNLVLMTFERFVSVVYPLHYRTIVTKSRTWKVIAVSWALYLLYSLIPCIANKGRSTLITNYKAKDSFTYIFHRVTASMFFVGTSVNMLMFIKIIHIIHKTKRNAATQPRRNRSRSHRKTYTVLIMVVSAFCCWFPAVAVMVVSIFDIQFHLFCIKIIPAHLGIVNASLNWIIHGMMKKSFRQTLKSLVLCRKQERSEYMRSSS